jgi:hypothetical protein
MSSNPFLFGLTDDQQDVLARAAGSVVPSDRDRLIRAVGRRLHGQVIGDGSLAVAIRREIATGTYARLVTAAVGSTAGAGKRKRSSKLLDAGPLAD